MKQFNVAYNIGKAKYIINSHDGEKKHTDGSEFFDIHLFSNKKLFQSKQKELIKQGNKQTN